MNISISIEMVGMYSTKPHPIHRRSLIRKMISNLGHLTFKIIKVKIVAANMEYAICI